MQRKSARVIILDQNKILLLHRFKKGEEYYSLPGGGIEQGETPEQAAMREAKEETNFDVQLGQLKGTLETEKNFTYFFAVNSWKGTLALGGPEKIRNNPQNSYELVWIALKDAKHLLIHPPGVKKFLPIS